MSVPVIGPDAPLDLRRGARPDERFHVSEVCACRRHFDWWLLRRTQWDCGTGMTFTSWWVFHRLQWYHGTAKCDGTRTRMYWGGQLGGPVARARYVMTTTPTELSAFRWRRGGPGVPAWDNMGGS